MTEAGESARFSESTSTSLAMCDPGDDILIFIQAEKLAVQHV